MAQTLQSDGVGTAADRAFTALCGLILSGAIGPGAKISEPDLAARFGISRAPLREALRRLEERKLVTRVARQGARATILSAARIAEIYRVREALEGVAARDACLRMSDAAIVELRALMATHEARVMASNVYLLGEEDDDLHACIIRASGNATLISLLLDEYYLLIRLLRGQLPRRGDTARLALAEHRAIVEAIGQRDAELAELLMRRHIAAAHRRLVELLPPPLQAKRARGEKAPC